MVLACGAVGGPRDANGAVVIGLREVANSGYSGIAYLAPRRRRRRADRGFAPRGPESRLNVSQNA